MKHSVKQLCLSLTILFFIIVGSFIPHHSYAQESLQDSVSLSDGDSVYLSLITCSQRDKVYGMYGHTAIRYVNKKTNEDWMFNYGSFNFNKPYFILRFIFGLTDYELVVVPSNSFFQFYRKESCKVVEQVLNLSSDEEQTLIMALDENYKPENRVYRYNYFYDNCATRARDIIERSVNGSVDYLQYQHDATYRQLVHTMTDNYPWAKFGNDMCLGFMADCKIDRRQQQFLPENLMQDFACAVITNGDDTRPLLSNQRVLFDTSCPVPASPFVTTPLFVFLVFALMIVVITFVEYRRKHTFRFFDITWMIITGMAGIVIVALFVSKHPTTSTNLQVLLINPLPLFFVRKVFGRRPTVFWRLYVILSFLFLFGGLIQDYADGMVVLALCLLLRCWINIKYSTIQNK